jgi:O-antigen/teichoic acid export membrane protein
MVGGSDSAWTNERIGRRFTSATLATGLNLFLGAAQSLVLVPFFVSAWGAPTYGAWLTATAMLAYVALLDLGGQGYIANELASRAARNDHAGFASLLSEGVSFFAVLAAASMVAVWLILAFTGLADSAALLNLPRARLILLLQMTMTIIAVPSGIYTAAFRATGRIAFATFQSSAILIGEIAVLALALWIKAPPLTVAIVLFCSGAVRTVIVVTSVRRRVPVARAARLSLSAAARGARLLSSSILYWLTSVSGALKVQGITLILASVMGDVAVATYGVHRTATGVLAYFSRIVVSTTLPEFSRLVALGRRDDLGRVTIFMVRVITLATAVGTVVLVLVLPLAFPSWTARRLTFDPVLTAAMCLQAVLAASWGTATWPLLAANRVRALAVVHAANAVATVVLGVVMAKSLGMRGVALASLIGDIAFGVVAVPLMLARSGLVTRTVAARAMLESVALAACIGASMLSALSGTMGALTIASMAMLASWIYVLTQLRRSATALIADAGLTIPRWVRPLLPAQPIAGSTAPR